MFACMPYMCMHAQSPAPRAALFRHTTPTVRMQVPSLHPHAHVHMCRKPALPSTSALHMPRHAGHHTKLARHRSHRHCPSTPAQTEYSGVYAGEGTGWDPYCRCTPSHSLGVMPGTPPAAQPPTLTARPAPAPAHTSPAPLSSPPCCSPPGPAPLPSPYPPKVAVAMAELPCDRDGHIQVGVCPVGYIAKLTQPHLAAATL